MMIYLVAVSAVFCFLAVFVGAFALYFGLQAWTKVQALEKATHTIQYVPLENGKDMNQKMEDLEDDAFQDLGTRATLEDMEGLA